MTTGKNRAVLARSPASKAHVRAMAKIVLSFYLYRLVTLLVTHEFMHSILPLYELGSRTARL